jgi:hypothetical protein
VRSVVEQPYAGPRPGGIGGLGGGAAEAIAPGQLEVATQAQVTFDVTGGVGTAAARPATVGTVSAQLVPVGATGVSGTVTVSGGGDGTTLTLVASGLEPGATYRAQVQVRGAASFGTLGELVADAQGRGQLTATAARVSASGAPAPLELAALADGEHVVSLVAPGAGVVAEAVLPRA